LSRVLIVVDGFDTFLSNGTETHKRGLIGCWKVWCVRDKFWNGNQGEDYIASI
jgi:hypothetical protein